MYLSVVKKLAKKLMDVFGDCWLVDWSNDCLDDVWTVRLGFADVNNVFEKEEFDEIAERLIELENIDEAEKDIGGEKSDKIPENGIKIWLDDIREAPEGFKWFKSVNDFIDWCHERNIGLILECNSGRYVDDLFLEQGPDAFARYREGKGAVNVSREDQAKRIREQFFIANGEDLYRSDVNKISFVLRNYQDHQKRRRRLICNDLCQEVA